VCWNLRDQAVCDVCVCVCVPEKPYVYSVKLAKIHSYTHINTSTDTQTATSYPSHPSMNRPSGTELLAIMLSQVLITLRAAILCV
jgi:hypothetical protein